MKYFNITVNGKVYQVTAEEVGAPGGMTSAPAPAVPAPAPAVPAPAPATAPAAAPRPAPAPGGGEVMSAPMPGTIIEVSVSVGQAVSKGQPVLVLEAMKMENEVFAAQSGTVAQIFVSKGDTVNAGDPMIQIS